MRITVALLGALAALSLAAPTPSPKKPGEIYKREEVVSTVDRGGIPWKREEVVSTVDRGGIPWKREEVVSTADRGGIPWKREEESRGGY